MRWMHSIGDARSGAGVLERADAEAANRQGGVSSCFENAALMSRLV
jgi:hypothetical protein